MVSLLAATVGVAVLHLVRIPSASGSNMNVTPVKSPEETTSERSFKENKPEDISYLANCTVSFEPPPVKGRGNWTTKPLWFPSHPDSISGFATKSIVNGITGLPAGGKSFYASSRASGLRHCSGPTETAMCIAGDMGDLNYPDTNAPNWFDQYIMGLRNPATLIPAFFNGKAIRYHGLCDGCQVPEDRWQQFRDDKLGLAMDDWKKIIEPWKATMKYKVGMYLVHEHLLDAQKGPLELKRLASVLRDAGFVTAPDEDMPCIWYKAIGKDSIELNSRGGYEYKDYVPGYTKVQQEFLLSELSNFTKVYKEDGELVAILKEYQENIRNNIRYDSAWVNQTKQNQ